jgi:hypothetical protein
VPITKENVDGIVVSLKIEGELSLFILLAQDGTMNRLGNGEDTNHRIMAIRQVEPHYFEQLRARVSDLMLQYTGRMYADPDRKGETCELTVLFRADGEETGIGYTYGDKSQGPPSEIQALVLEAAAITEQWYLAEQPE